MSCMLPVDYNSMLVTYNESIKISQEIIFWYHKGSKNCVENEKLLDGVHLTTATLAQFHKSVIDCLLRVLKMRMN